LLRPGSPGRVRFDARFARLAQSRPSPHGCQQSHPIPSKVANDLRFSGIYIDIISIDIDIIYDVGYTGKGFIFMKRGKTPEAIHTWLIILKALQAVRHFALPPILKQGLGDSDFRVLELLLHKGPMPVNALGPKVGLNPGSVSVAVDRLYKKGLVSRVESKSDRRVRTVSLTEKGRRVIVPIFRQHAALIKLAFQDVSPKELRQMEELLKRIGRRAEELAEQEGNR
jgi:MarR family transcriptional regulator, 2-MHQ and catechol-resistance regulon repressor